MSTTIKRRRSAAPPTIIKVEDSQGSPIDNPGTTQDSQLTLSGSGTVNGVVSIRDNGLPLGTASVPGGVWLKTVTATVGRHSYTVRDTTGVESSAWVITIESATVKPQITFFEDSAGVQILPGGSTLDPNLTIAGTALVNGSVELIQDSVSRGDTPVNANGLWRFQVQGLSVGSHNFQVRANYGSSPVSDVESITVTAASAPTIDSIKDPAGVEIPPDTLTLSASITLTGTAAVNQQVEMLDNTTFLGRVTATGGDWTYATNTLSQGRHSFTVRGLYGLNPVSPPRTLTVAGVVSGFEDFEEERCGIFFTVPHECRSGLEIAALAGGGRSTILCSSKFPSTVLQVAADEEVEIKLPGVSRMVTFDVSAYWVANSRITYHDSEGQQIGSSAVPVVVPQFSFQSMPFSAPSGEYIASIRIKAGGAPGGDWVCLDRIGWTA